MRRRRQKASARWSPSGDPFIVSYKLYYRLAGGPINVITTAGTNTALNGLTEDTTVFFTVSAVDNAGVESAPSAELSYSVPIPSTPFLLYYTNTTWQSVTLAWVPTANTNIAHYILYYDTASGGQRYAVYAYLLGIYTFDNQLGEGSTYFFTVYAVDSYWNIVTNSNEAVRYYSTSTATDSCPSNGSDK